MGGGPGDRRQGLVLDHRRYRRWPLSSTAMCPPLCFPASWAPTDGGRCPAAVLLGIPMYSNAAGIIPVVEALLGKGAAPRKPCLPS